MATHLNKSLSRLISNSCHNGWSLVTSLWWCPSQPFRTQKWFPITDCIFYILFIVSINIRIAIKNRNFCLSLRSYCCYTEACKSNRKKMYIVQCYNRSLWGQTICLQIPCPLLFNDSDCGTRENFFLFLFLFLSDKCLGLLRDL